MMPVLAGLLNIATSSMGPDARIVVPGHGCGPTLSLIPSHALTKQQGSILIATIREINQRVDQTLALISDKPE